MIIKNKRWKKMKKNKNKNMTLEDIMEEREDYDSDIPYGEGEIITIDGVQYFIR